MYTRMFAFTEMRIEVDEDGVAIVFEWWTYTGQAVPAVLACKGTSLSFLRDLTLALSEQRPNSLLLVPYRMEEGR